MTYSNNFLNNFLKVVTTMKAILTNEFTINALTASSNLAFTQITLAEAKDLLSAGFVSAVSWPASRLFQSLLGLEVPCNQTKASLEGDTTLVVGQYTVPTLPERAYGTPIDTTLPEVEVQWWVVTTIK